MDRLSPVRTTVDRLSQERSLQDDWDRLVSMMKPPGQTTRCYSAMKQDNLRILLRIGTFTTGVEEETRIDL